MAISIPQMIWPDNAKAAIKVQQELRNKVSLVDNFQEIKTIAGIDCSYDIKTSYSFAVITIVDYRTLKTQQSIIAKEPTTFPYVPGLLSFREIPVILKALAALEKPVELLMVDGQGVAHPRRLGIAAHLGALLDMPAIGVAKSLLTGKYQQPAQKQGSRSNLLSGTEKIGTVLRSKDNVQPLFISPGHRVSHETAVEITLSCVTKYRLPEPTRLADKISKTYKSEVTGNLLVI